MTWEVIQGDCLDVIREMESGSVDAVVTDPPYGQTNEDYDRGVAPEVWSECFRIAKPDAALLSFAGSPTYHRIASDIEAVGWYIRQMWGWVYRDGFMTSAWPREGFDRLAPAIDPICYATKGKVLLALERDGQSEWKRERVGTERCAYSQRAGGHGAAVASGHWPRSVIASEGLDGFQYFVLSRTNPSLRDDRGKHPNQKPLSLMEWLLSKLPPNGTVLDPFAGSGTTGVAAVRLGHSFIGIEREQEYCEIARKRISEAAAARQELLPLE